MTVKRAPPLRRRRPVDARPDLGDDGGAEGHVGYEVAVHDIDVDPVAAVAHDALAFGPELGEVRAQDGWVDDGGGWWHRRRDWEEEERRGGERWLFRLRKFHRDAEGRIAEWSSQWLDGEDCNAS